MTSGLMRAGVARVDITPPLGLDMDGYLGRGAAIKVGRPLSATALAIAGSTASTPIVIVACDLLCLSSSALDSVRAEFRRHLDIAVHIMLSCSHTHTGPVTEGHPLLDVPQGAETAAYLSLLVELIATVIVEAIDDMTEVTVAYACTEARIGVNRRRRDAYGTTHMEPNPDGAYDPRVDVLRIDRVEGSRPLAVVMNAACHAVSLGDLWREWHPDFPGVARDIVEAETGAVALFLQGAAGDVNSLLFGHDASHPVEIGSKLGDAVVAAWRRSVSVVPSALSGRSLVRRVRLPRMRTASPEEADDRVRTLERELAKIAADAPDDPKYLRWARVRLQNAESERSAVHSGTTPEPFEVELTAVAFDEQTAIVTAPGEVFTELAQRIRSGSPFANLIYSGYTNGSVYYIPTRSAYSEGGYEIESACFVAPEAGEMLIAESLSLLEQLHQSR